MLNEIKTLTQKQILGILFGFVGVVSPGLLIMFLYKPELVSSLETIKLIIFSISLSLPVVIINMIPSSYVSNEKDTFSDDILIALFLSAVALYPSILISYIYNFSFTKFLFALLIMQAALIVLVIIDEKYDKKKT